MRRTKLLSVVLMTTTACSLVPAKLGGAGGAPAPSPSMTASSPAASPSPSPSSGSSASGGSAPSERAAPSAPDLAASRAEAHLAKLLEKDARYSVAIVQGKPGSLCVVASSAKFVPLAIWELESNGNVTCYAMKDHDLASFKEGFYAGIREFQDHGALNRTEFVAGEPGKFTFVKRAKAVFITQRGDRTRIARIPLTDKASGLDRDLVLNFSDQFLQADKLEFDILVTRRDAAKGIDLAAEKATFWADAQAELKQQAEQRFRADAEKLAKTTFPKPQGAAAPNLLQAVRAHLETGKADINPKLVKKLAVTSGWSVHKSRIGLILNRVIDVTVGFERDDAYAIDPNKKCAFATFEIQQNHGDTGYEKEVFATGMATGWTNIKCDRLK